MRWLRIWSQYYVSLLNRLGLVRFSILVAAGIIVLAVAIQAGFSYLFEGDLHPRELIKPLFFSLVITPWAVYFLSMVVEQQEVSQAKLRALLEKMEHLRARDLLLNRQLHENIEVLNQEIEERRKAKQARKQAIAELRDEVQRRKIAQLELEERSALLRSFLDSSPDIIYFRDEEGRFSGCNRAMELLTGKKESELQGLTPFDVYAREIAERVMETDREVLSSNQPVTNEMWLAYPDGHKALFELRKVPFFTSDGHRLGLLGFGRDVTERRRYAESLERASEEKTRFIATISHELRTPLNGIVGLSRILLDSNLDDEQRQHLKTIYASAETLGHIFNDIIDLDKFERRRLVLAAKPIVLDDFFNDIETLSRLLAEQKGLQLGFERLASLDYCVMGDGTRLRQILWNLVGNAVKFTENGRITIRVRSEPRDDCVALGIEVEDSGSGIPKDKLEKIFAMYYQVEGMQKATGTGIGLAVCRRLVNAMKGSINVTSELGRGSCFRVSLMLPYAEKPQLSEPQTEHHLQILLVEDVELNVTVATALLEKLGHKVDVAMTGFEALRMANAHSYDLILLDIQLPDINGFEVAQRLRDEIAEEHIPPLVALTANVIKDRSTYYEQGLDDAISKPLSVEAVTGMLSRLFSAGWDEEEEGKDDEQVSGRVDARLALPLLEQYRETIGSELLLSSLQLFEEKMPEYLSVLDSNLIARDQAGIVEQAHKIKGAAGSVGLKYLQQVAQKAQSPELPAWWDNIDDWVEILKEEYPDDLALLRQWLRTEP